MVKSTIRSERFNNIFNEMLAHLEDGMNENQKEFHLPLGMADGEMICDLKRIFAGLGEIILKREVNPKIDWENKVLSF